MLSVGFILGVLQGAAGAQHPRSKVSLMLQSSKEDDTDVGADTDTIALKLCRFILYYITYNVSSCTGFDILISVMHQYLELTLYKPVRNKHILVKTDNHRDRSMDGIDRQAAKFHSSIPRL